MTWLRAWMLWALASVMFAIIGWEQLQAHKPMLASGACVSAIACVLVAIGTYALGSVDDA
jgi:hypothetical protein